MSGELLEVISKNIRVDVLDFDLISSVDFVCISFNKLQPNALLSLSPQALSVPVPLKKKKKI